MNLTFEELQENTKLGKTSSYGVELVLVHEDQLLFKFFVLYHDM